MTLHHHQESPCYVASCDGCLLDDPGWDYIPHFDSPEAAKTALESWGWVVRIDPGTGTVRSVWCDECWAAKDEIEKADA